MGFFFLKEYEDGKLNEKGKENRAYKETKKQRETEKEGKGERKERIEYEWENTKKKRFVKEKTKTNEKDCT